MGIHPDIPAMGARSCPRTTEVGQLSDSRFPMKERTLDLTHAKTGRDNPSIHPPDRYNPVSPIAITSFCVVLVYE